MIPIHRSGERARIVWGFAFAAALSACLVGCGVYFLLSPLASFVGRAAATTIIAVVGGAVPAPVVWYHVVRPLARRYLDSSSESREARTRFQHLFEEMTSGVFVYQAVDGGADFRITELNPAAASLVEVEPHDVIGHSASDFFPYLDESGILDIYREVLASGRPAHHPPKKYEDGRLSLWLERRIYRLPTREIVTLVDDVTERIRAEEAIRASEENYRQVVENSHDAILVLQDGYVQFANRRAMEVSGYSMEEITSVPWVDRIVEEDRETLTRRYQDTISHRVRNPDIQQFGLRSKKNGVLWLETRAVAFDWKGRPASLNFVRDITERLELERRLLQSQKMEAVGTLAAGVAHDFNNFLTVFQGNAALLEADMPSESPMRELVQEISAASVSAASLTRQLLAFSRKQTLQPRLLDLNGLLADLAKMLGRILGEDIELRLCPGEGLSKVNADPAQLEQVIVNLAVNARDAMPRGGRLTLETSNVMLHESYVGMHPDAKSGPHVRLSVSDTGEGIPKELQSQVFEPFFTTKEKGKGTGLGLSTVFGIVKQSGGCVELYSEPEQGTTFKVYLPHAGVESRDTDEPKEDARPEDLSGSETILLVEDSPQVRGLTRRMLERSGYTVLEAAGGEEALFLSERVSGPIHLLLTDVVMPEMNGRTVADRLVRERPDTRVLFMSGYTDDAIAQHGVLDPSAELLQKPFGPGELLLRVRSVLNREGSGRVRSVSRHD